MKHGEVMLNAVRNTFPAVDLLCRASEEECQNLLLTFDMFPEKAVMRMVKDNMVRLDEDTEVVTNEGSAKILGPDSELNGAKGVMKFVIKNDSLGAVVEDRLEILCDARPNSSGSEVLCYSYFDFNTFKKKYRGVLVKTNPAGEVEVNEEYYDNARQRGFTRSDYRNAHENE